jgi:cell division protein FtsB
MRLLKVLLLLGFLALQYRLWFGDNGIRDYYRHQEQVERFAKANEKLIKRNKLLAADVKDLKSGLEGLEERARNELGMIAPNETFFRIIPTKED